MRDGSQATGLRPQGLSSQLLLANHFAWCGVVLSYFSVFVSLFSTFFKVHVCLCMFMPWCVCMCVPEFEGIRSSRTRTVSN